MVKVLVTTPLCVPSYFNAGHRLAMYQVAGYLREQELSVVVSEMASLNVTWKDLADFLTQNDFDYVVLFNDFDLLEGFSRFIEYVREFSPWSKIVTFGRLSSSNPGLFKQFDIDGIVASGDYEPGVSGFIEYSEGNQSHPDGVMLRFDSQWAVSENTGLYLPVENWILPNISEISYASYDELYSSDQRKFCGIPERRELVVPLARGCPVGCNFCEVWPREGLAERRLSVKQVIEYIETSFQVEPFEYASMYAPTFTLKKKWVKDFCKELISLGSIYPWKCTTTMFHLDKELVTLMGEAGCFRISVGLESLEDPSLENLPVHKHDAKQKFDDLLSWCNEAGIELNCFVIVGLPDTTVDGTRDMFEYLENKVRIRPSIFSDYSLISDDMTEQEALRILSRHMLPSNTQFSAIERLRLYGLVFGIEENITQVMNKIPKRN